MRIWIAHEGETLRTIAYKNDVQTENLISLNSHIANPDQNITGKPVYLPYSPATKTPKYHSPSCPPPLTPPIYLNHWLPLTSLEQMADIEYDVLIVGTGAGGGTVIWRLCEQRQKSNKRIGVIEAETFCCRRMRPIFPL
ncbi:LysM peptidoglycan-binding domain-containing protein [Paenibacillus sp. Leaf72]|uniref:LysM peptidoglycan-binding domain-containing protein n=1 Tax=Paenibacillus sp. Leaf72 TaxID=1736234 RepID=UPI00070225D8|nr:LysM peptidoglycan-binding domain-containing protein [Paenibacillus sp. Leaf72]KQN99915.1 hypothetical protein ASF12_17160 [Paenibacillus sp. Leaf72]